MAAIRSSPVDRFTNEAKRIYGVLDRRLAEAEYLGGSEYSIADIATFPWLVSWEWQVVLAEYPNLERWFNTIAARPPVQRGLAVLAELKRKPKELSEAEREILFGAKQYERR